MSHLFGGPVRIDGLNTTAGTSAVEDMDIVRRALQRLKTGEAGVLRFYRPVPTAAFAPRDITSEHYRAAAGCMRSLGFAPVERLAGGHLAVYDEHALVIDLVAPHPEPRQHIHGRFKIFAEAIATALATQGVDASIGELPGEYCPGSSSINGEGRIKLVGLAQRVVGNGYHLGAVISVQHSSAAKQAVTTAYQILGLPFDPKTFGAVSDLAGLKLLERVCQAIQTSVVSILGSNAVSGE